MIYNTAIETAATKKNRAECVNYAFLVFIDIPKTQFQSGAFNITWILDRNITVMAVCYS